MIKISINFNNDLNTKDITPKTSVAQFKQFLLDDFPALKDHNKICAKIKSSKKEIELYIDEDAKLLEKYEIKNDETIIIHTPIKSQKLRSNQKKLLADLSNGLQTQNFKTFYSPRACPSCVNYQEELKKKQIEIDQLQLQLQKEHLPTIRNQNFMQSSSDNFFQTQYLSQTQSVFQKTQAESIQGRLLVEDLEKMAKQLYISEIDQLKQRIMEKDIEIDKLKQHYEKLMKDSNEFFSYFKSQMSQDKEFQKQNYQEKFELQSKEITRLKEEAQQQSKLVIKLREIYTQNLESQQKFFQS